MHLRIWLLSALLAVVYDNTVQQMVGYFTARTPIPMVIAAAMLLDLIVSKLVSSNVTGHLLTAKSTVKQRL